jgi:hypothetical protein
MAAAQYKQFYERMVDENQELFDQFQMVHDAYVINPEVNKARFNAVGKEVLRLMQRTENQLCRQTERGGYGRYSANLAEKFRAWCKEKFPKIGMVGVK